MTGKITTETSISNSSEHSCGYYCVINKTRYGSASKNNKNGSDFSQDGNNSKTPTANDAERQ